MRTSIPLRRSLTGAWIETSRRMDTRREWSVAPLRGRGLKQGEGGYPSQGEAVAPLRGRGLKQFRARGAAYFSRRSLTGAWIETEAMGVPRQTVQSLPYGGVD